MKKILLFLALALAVGCSDNKTSIEPDPDSGESKTIIVYMVADNSLSTNAYSDIQEMEYAMADIASDDYKLIVYVDKNYNPTYEYDSETDSYTGTDEIGSLPKIIEIVGDKSTTSIASKTIKTYGEQISTDPTVIKSVIGDIIDFYPADSYGLILWSHGTGWIEASLTTTDTSAKLSTMSFGDDNSYGINNDVLAAALPISFDFIWFDCCLMGNAETLYEYRSKASTIVASPNEILAYGAPYEKIVPYLFEGDYDGGAKSFFYHYSSNNTDLCSGSVMTAAATIAVYDPSKLEDLATVIAAQTERCGGYPTVTSTTGIQTMGYSSAYQKQFFDLVDAIDYLFDNEAVEAVEAALDELISYKAATSSFGSVAMNTYCGISIYVPKTTDQNTYYNSLSWTQAVGWDD